MRGGAKDATTVAMMKPAILACVLVALPACNKLGGGAGGGGNVTPTTEDQKTLYALGLMIGRNVAQFNLTPDELNYVKAGITDQALDHKPQVELQQYGPKVNMLGRKRSEEKAQKEKQKGHDYAETVAKEPGAERTTSGMIFRSLTPGNGPQPTKDDVVRVNYKGSLVDGTEFDSSYKRGQPAEFPLNGVIPCWTEGVQKMHVGEKAKLVCPSAIAYGDGGRPNIPGGATLTFEVELLEIKKPTTPTPAQMNAMHGLSGPGTPMHPMTLPNTAQHPAMTPPPPKPAGH
jgi:FKBP-type peptidyl-prolyl cis-trans isomerase FkpA